MVQQNNLNAALKVVSAFIESLMSSEMLSSEDRRFDLYFWHAGEGTLFLSAEEAQQYRDCLRALLEAVSSSEQISPPSVERVFQNAIFAALDIRNQRTPEFKARLEQALQELPQTFRVYHCVNGLAPEGLPSTVGNVDFVVFDDRQLDKFREAAAKHAVDEEQRELRRQLLEELSQEKDLADHVVAVVTVAAIEGGAAELLATRELRLVIDVINFYSDLIPYNHAHLSLPGDADAARVVIPKLVVDGSQRGGFSVHNTLRGRLGELSLPKLWELDSRRNLGFSRVAKLLGGRRNDLEERIIAAIQWAGRATAEIRKETAFLLYAIALESIVLSDNYRTELTYRLRVRTAHLLADGIDSRRDLFSKLGKLYEIRSEIVHNGRYQVTDADLSLLRSITKAALIRICTGTEFLSMRSGKELGKWFQDRVLE